MPMEENEREKRIRELTELLRQKKNSGSRVSWRKGTFLLLLALTIVTLLAVSTTMAKYASSFTTAGVTHIAAFATGNTLSFDTPIEGLVPGSVQTLDFVVTNFEGDRGSDVWLEYEIQVETTGNLPLQFGLAGKKEEGDTNAESCLAGALDSAGKATGGKFPAADESNRITHSYTLTITWPEEKTNVEYSGEVDMVTVTITTQQAPTEAK